MAHAFRMPVQFCSASRRQFLSTLGIGAVAVFGPPVAGVDLEADLIYLLNDTHIGEKHPPQSPVPSHLREVVDELVARPRPPAAVLINGDLALRDGQSGDYRHLAKLLRPLREALLNVHLTLGNHDDRDVFYDVLKDERPTNPPVASRHISVVRTRHANFFLLDSLIKPMVTQGELGAAQLRWLAAALDQQADRPAIIVTHHNPRLGGDPVHFPGGLIDSEPLWDLLESRRHVKAYVHGHIHHWSHARHRGIHIINTPATSYVGNKELSTTGWTTARLRPDGVTLTIHTNDKTHRWNGERAEFTWRSDG